MVLLIPLITGCGDKLLAAKTTVTFISLGVQTARQAVATAAKAKRTECLKLGDETTEAFKKCYADTQKMLAATDKLWPQLDQALATATAAINANGNYVPLIKASACLLVKLTTWIPDKYKAKVEQWIKLVGALTCDGNARVIDPVRQRLLLVKLRALLLELGARA
jgi:hypothetical protein